MRPYQCQNCKNWYMPLQLDEGVVCISCARGLHAIPETGNHPGVVDCHFGETTPHPSEIRMVEIDAQVSRAVLLAQDAVRLHNIASLRQAEDALAEVEQIVTQQVPEVLTWASVKEMPGLVGENPSMRFKNLDALQELVSNNRRPVTDIEEIRRSIKTCAEINSGIPSQVAEIRTTLAEARSLTTTPVEPEKEPVTA